MLRFADSFPVYNVWKRGVETIGEIERLRPSCDSASCGTE